MEKNKIEQDKPIKTRGASHPYANLEQAVKLCGELKNAVGKGPFSREVAAQGLGHKSVSGPAAAKIAALVHFGLLSRSGSTYTISPLTERILLPTSPEDKSSAIVGAVKKPKLYKQLIDKYHGQSLPLMLENILIREFKIYEKKAKEVAKNFRKSLEYAGLLNKGVIIERQPKDIVENQTENKVSGVLASPEKQSAEEGSAEYHIVELPSGIKIQFPIQMSYPVATGEFSDEIKELNQKAIQESKKDKPKKSHS